MEVNARRSKGRYILYGAVVDVSERTSLGVKAYIKRFIDKTAFRIGYVDRIDYRNHQDRHAYNRGDHSIIVAMAQRIREMDESSRIVAVQWGELKAAKLTKADKVLICGSGYFFPNSRGEFPQRLFSDLRAIQESGSELHYIGVGYNYLLAWDSLDKRTLPVESRQLLTGLLDRAITLTVRDGNTKKFLSNFTKKSIKVIGDPALFIDSPPALGPARGMRRRPRVGINIPFHGPQSMEWMKKNLRHFIAAMKRLQRLTKCDFTYFVHYDSELLISEIIRSRWIRMDVVNVGAAKLPHEYAKMDMHIGGMLHSCIIATAAHVPSIGLAYDEKHFGFFELMGRSKYCLNANNFDAGELVEVSVELLKDVSSEVDGIINKKQNLSCAFDSALRSALMPQSSPLPASNECSLP